MNIPEAHCHKTEHSLFATAPLKGWRGADGVFVFQGGWRGWVGSGYFT